LLTWVSDICFNLAKYILLSIMTKNILPSAFE